MTDRVSVRGAAKLNLTLQITGVAGGLHTLDMLCCSVDLYETITLVKNDAISLSSNVDVPTDNRNTAYRMAEVFFKETGIDGGVSISIDKTVPIGAGMGGGSADAAAVLIGLNLLYGTELPEGELLRMGLMVGSDVPLCIVGGLCRVGGVGDEISVIDHELPYYFVAVMGGEAVSTAEAYRRYDDQGAGEPADTETAVKLLGTDMFLDEMKNDLEHSSTLKLDEIKQDFYRLGAKKSMMTGSGAVVYGVYSDIEAAQSAADKIGRKAWVLRPVAKGVEILK